MSSLRLFAGLGNEPMSYARHCEVHGPGARFQGAELRGQLAEAQLRGRGGGAFPLARKIDAVVRRRRRPVLVANGCEGEPMSSKDRVLLRSVPHLVLDGAVAVGDAIGAERILLAIDERDVLSAECLEDALSERLDDRRMEVVPVESGYVSGQETALVNAINGRGAAPSPAPPRVTDRGVGGRPTLVSNVETLAHAALIARRGAGWFRRVGTDEDPGTTLITLSGAVASPGVYEVELGTRLATLLRDAGAPPRAGGVLVGGYAGSWVDPEHVPSLHLDRASARRARARLGSGVVVVLPVDGCPVAETVRAVEWMAQQSTGQCGPCVHGLAAVADALGDVRRGHDGRRALADVARWAGQIPGRGACAHPDGAVGLVASALRVFQAALLDHADHGPCADCHSPGVLRTPLLTPAGAAR